MKMKQFLVGACALTLLASCSGGANVDKIVEGFETTVPETTAKVTFNSKYKVDVQSEKGGMDSFKHDVDDKVVADIDLTKDNLYLYVKNDAKDGTNAKTREALLYKDGSSYKYVTSVMENPLTLASEAAAKAKIDELLAKISGNLAGYVDTSSLLFTKGGAYEHKQFGLGTENIPVDEFLNDTTKIEAAEKGVKVTGELDYIGYHTDAGISDFPGKDGAKASSYEINTNEKGLVTSYTQNMDASLAMPIMTPAPIVTIKGAKAFNATYGEELTKKTTIAHELTTTKLEITSSEKGHVDVFTTPTLDGEKTPVIAGSTLTVGQYLAVKVTPAGANTIKMVTFAGSSKETAEADGYYYFEIPEGKAALTVNFDGSAIDESVKYAVANVVAPEGFTYVAKYFVYTTAPGERQELINGKLPVGNSYWGSFIFTAPKGYVVPEGKQLAAFIGDAKLMAFPTEDGNLEFCFQVKEEKTYDVEYKLVDALPEFKTKDFAVLGKLSVQTCAPFKFDAMTNVEMGTKLVAGNWLCIKPKDGVSIKSMKINGKDCMMDDPTKTGGFYCWELVSGVNFLEVEFN